MTTPQTAIFDDRLSREDSVGTRLVEQFKDNHSKGRTRRFMEVPRTCDPSDVDIERFQTDRDVAETEPPLLWHDSSPEQGEGVALQKWEGVVVSISENSFCARLHDLTAANPEEEAEFSIEDVAEDDRALVQPGAIFYWSIGYYTSRTGQKLRSSIIKFRRLPAWSAKEIKIIEHKARELGRAIGWGSEESATCAG